MVALLWWAPLLCALLLPGVAAATPPMREAADPTAQEPLRTPIPPTTDAAERTTGLLANGDFERGALTGWEADADVALSAEQVHSGGWAWLL